MKTSFLSVLIIAFCAVTPTLAAQWGSRANHESGFPHHPAPASKHRRHPKNQTICHVPDIGTDSDSGPNIRQAFEDCQRDSKIILDSHYVIETLIVTPRLSNVSIELTGTIEYLDNLTHWTQPTNNTERPESLNLTNLNAAPFFYLQGDNIHLYGTLEALSAGRSAFNGQGQLWWNAHAENNNSGNASGNSTTFARPILFMIGESTNVSVQNVAFLQAPSWHTFIVNSTNVQMDTIIISAVSNASFPSNTAGIDISRSSFVNLTNWDVNNGDDCVILGRNTTDVEVGHINCNGTNGVSLGSLGQYRGVTDIIENVWIHDIAVSNAKYGVRVKVWPGSNTSAPISTIPDPASGGGLGYVKNVTFENVEVHNVDYPIFLTSCFKHNASYCEANPTNMTVSDIHYINVTGSASGKKKNVVAALDCSKNCTDITAEGTNLTLPSSVKGLPVYDCTNVASKDQLDFNCTEVKLTLDISEVRSTFDI